MTCIHDSEDESITGSVQSPEALNVLDLLVHLEAKKKVLFKDVLTVESNSSTQEGCSYPHPKKHEKVPLISLQEKIYI